MKTSYLTYLSSFFGFVCFGVYLYYVAFESHLDLSWRVIVILFVLSSYYANFRLRKDEEKIVEQHVSDVVKIDPMYKKFLKEDESRRRICKEDLISIFYKWKDEQY